MHLVLVRHAMSTANSDGVLAGRMDGIHLNERGREQSEAIVGKFAQLQISGICGSPLSRCRETAEPLCIDKKLPYNVDERLNEVEYGSWSGRKLAELNEDPLWDAIQKRPNSVVFPQGEAMAGVFDRVTDFLNSMRGLEDEEIVVAFSHGDVIKACIASAYDIPRDAFQRVVIDPAGISLLRLSQDSTFVVRVNDSEATLSSMMARKGKDAVVGGEKQ